MVSRTMPDNLWNICVFVCVCVTYMFVTCDAGTYYHWPMRVVGVRLMFINRVMEQRPSYRILGIALAVQLALSSALWLGRRYRPMQLLDGRGAAKAGPGKAVVLTVRLERDSATAAAAVCCHCCCRCHCWFPLPFPCIFLLGKSTSLTVEGSLPNETLGAGGWSARGGRVVGKSSKCPLTTG